MFLSTFSDDLRCPFSFFFFFFGVMVVFGLARDGCLVRSWFGVAQRGGAAGRRRLLGFDMATKPIEPQQPQGGGYEGKMLIEKTGKILNEKTGKNLHKFNQNQALKSILK